MTLSRLQIGLALPLAVALAAVAILGPAAGIGEAAQCKGSAEPAFRISDRAAAKATLCLLNKQRSSHGMKPLHRDGKQTRAAYGHNRLMVRSGCFSHLCPGEKDLLGRIASTGYLPCSCTWQIGENIAWGSGNGASPRAIVSQWMHSPPHRENILDRRFDEIGVAVTAGSPGHTDGGAATYTTDFGFKG